MQLRPFFPVVAATSKMGIGLRGDLPWGRLLPEEFKYFARVTSEREEADKPNVVIMGRLTWLSIPAKQRPLKNRLNVVLSSKHPSEFDSAGADLVCTSLEHALHEIDSPARRATTGKIFIIGGAALYNETMVHARCGGVYLTEVEGEFECDTFMDPVPLHLYRRDAAYAQPAEENGVRYVKQLYVREEHAELRYLELMRRILETGERRGDRTGVGTIALFGTQLRFDLSKGFPLLTTKKVFFRGIKEELLWFLRGSTDAKELSEKKVRIWEGNGSREFLDSRGLSHYSEGELGPVYGFQWRHWGAEYEGAHADYSGKGVDQIAEALRMIREEPQSRRIIVSAWNVGQLGQMALPPCHILAQFQVSRGRLNCSMYQRSADMALGVPFNIASYALLTHLLARASSLEAGDLILSFGDCHVYSNHEQGVREQLLRTPRAFPTLKLEGDAVLPWEWKSEDISIEGYEPHPAIKLEMAI